MRLLITSGPTRAPLDAVRFIMNTSSGSLGATLAEEAVRRGWSVDLVHGVGALVPPPRAGLTLWPVSWLQELEPILSSLSTRHAYDAVFHTMAVLDYAPREALPSKHPSGHPWTVVLEPTPKLVDRFSSLFPGATLIAFKLETGISEQELVSRAATLARRCGAKAVVANLLEWVREDYHCLIVDAQERVVARVWGREGTAGWLCDFVGPGGARAIE